MPTFDLSVSFLRELNSALPRVEEGSNDIHFDILNPRGHHAVAVGIAAHLTVDIKGSVGYYCAGMNDGADIVIHGSAGPCPTWNTIAGTALLVTHPKPATRAPRPRGPPPLRHQPSPPHSTPLS